MRTRRRLVDDAETHRLFTCFAKCGFNGICLRGFSDDNHADAAIERAQHFFHRHTASGCQPFEDRQDRHCIEIKRDADTIG